METVHGISMHVLPSAYRLRLDVSLAQARYSGRVEIDVKLLRAVSSIELNARDIQIQHAHVVNKAGTVINARSPSASAASIDSQNELATLNFDGTLSSGKWTIVLEFTGSLIQFDLKGLYRMKWDGDSESWLVATNFLPNSARAAFPCFDAPWCKATFAITLIVDKQVTAVSNMPIASEKSLDSSESRKIVSFKRSPKISPHLVALAIGEFESSQTVTVAGKSIRILSAPGTGLLTSYALKCAALAVGWFERFYARPLFMEKLDLIALPMLRTKAVESAGVINFQASALLLLEVSASTVEKQRVMRIVFHEIAKQWMGAEVTFWWWNEYAFSESLAAVISLYAMSDFEPDFDRLGQLRDIRLNALRLDGQSNSHPLLRAINDANELERSFDQLSYEKGISLIHEMIQLVGFDTFTKGVRLLMERFTCENAEVGHLWAAMMTVCGSEGSFVELWLHKVWGASAGYPLLRASMNNEGLLALEQVPFWGVQSSEGELDASLEGVQLLITPVQVRYGTADGAVHSDVLWFSQRQQEFRVADDMTWIVVNAGAWGFYRVEYDSVLLARLSERGILEVLSAVERLNLLTDVWATFEAGLTSADTYLSLLARFVGEADPLVWRHLLASLPDLISLTHRPLIRSELKGFIAQLVEPALEALNRTPGCNIVGAAEIRDQLQLILSL